MSEVKHQHCWSYVYAVYGGSSKERNTIRRWCKCGTKQVGVVTYFRAERPNEFDQTSEAAKELSR